MNPGAFSRTRQLMAVRNDVAPAMAKWWKAQMKDDGQVSQDKQYPFPLG